MLNYLSNTIEFVDTSRLTPLRNGKYEVESLTDLIVVKRLMSQNRPLRAHIDKQELCLIEGIPVVYERLIDADPIPMGDELILVSKQYADACRRLCRDTSRLRLTCGAVYLVGESFPVASTGITTVEACLPFVRPDLFEDYVLSDIARCIRDTNVDSKVNRPLLKRSWGSVFKKFF